ncbi:endonuclease MutS2-like [Zingiber officinale]|uniref:endonuclease MutS2-like n=1 Tax=Zingiber officinale TaxID=94328 RepID=UPI001C4CBB09|nr:endonuclease MutS2-like [Zingiber officinale]
MEAFNSFLRLMKPPNLFTSDFPAFASPNCNIPKSELLCPFNFSSSVDLRLRVLKPFKDGSKLSWASNRLKKNKIEAGFASDADRIRIAEDLLRETEEILEWGSVCAQVSAFASTSAGRAVCQSGSLPVGRDREESEKLLDQTAAATLLPRKLDFSGIDDVSEIVRSAVGGEILGIRQLCAIEGSLRSAKRVFEQLGQVSADVESSGRYSALLEILQDCDFLEELTNRIGFCIDCKLSVVLDRASTKLEFIRFERRHNMEKLESLLKEVSIKVFQSGGIDSPLVTKRRSRMCVGIKASHKSLLPEGIVLSSSSSGATYFIEPRDAIELNNMEVRLFNEEKTEELAILCLLTSEIADAEKKIGNLMEKILELDLAVARGAHALWLGGVRPFFSQGFEKSKAVIARDSLAVDIKNIQHPLLLEPSLRSLYSSSERDGSSKMFGRMNNSMDPKEFLEFETPVPVDFRIKSSTRMVVISGPNTGGKTASMKTLGLASLMAKAGFFLSAKDRPKLPWFDQILADIGDHQSLEHNLSTFSGHISRICKIIEIASKNSLVLIDEIGSGTDPSEGVALSTSILLHLANNVNLAVVTTHYADLSHLKSGDSRFENAAMEFCLETLQPTFHILWGSIGNSNALSIAKSIGFDEKVLNRAKEWVKKLEPDKEKERQGSLYQSLSEERELLAIQANEAEFVLEEVKKLYLEIQSEAEDIDKRVATLKAREAQLAQQELKNVKLQMDSIIKDFENHLQTASLDQFSSLLRESEAAIASVVLAHHPEEDSIYESAKNNSYLPQIGDQVYVKGLGGKLATVVEAPVADGITTVQYGKVKVRVKRNDMKLVESGLIRVNNSGVERRVQTRNRATAMQTTKNEEASFGPAVKISKNTVDLRGMRVEEASLRLQMAISTCRPYQVLFIVHGMGTGAVKECALQILRNHPRVAKYEEESSVNYGCTIAYIK